MEKKDTWIIVAIIAIIGVVFLGPSLTGKALFQPVQAADIKANSCDRDNNCEIKNAEIAEKLGIGTAPDWQSKLHIKGNPGATVFIESPGGNVDFQVGTGNADRASLLVRGDSYAGMTFADNNVGSEWSVGLLGGSGGISPNSFVIWDQITGNPRLIIPQANEGLVEVQNDLLVSGEASASITLEATEPSSQSWNIQSSQTGYLSFSKNNGESTPLQIAPNGVLVLNELTGSGNAYVCINANGDLYRSTSPCN